MSFPIVDEICRIYSSFTKTLLNVFRYIIFYEKKKKSFTVYFNKFTLYQTLKLLYIIEVQYFFCPVECNVAYIIYL